MVRIDSTQFRFKHVYDINRLRQYDAMCDREIERFKNAIEEIKEYQMKLHHQAQKVTETEFYKVVTLQRQTQDRVRFFVRLVERPIAVDDSKGESPYGIESDFKEFLGKDRHKAIAYAKSLAAKYHCEIERKGFKKR